MAYIRGGEEVAYGYEPKGYRGFMEFEKKIKAAGVSKGKYRRKRGYTSTALLVNANIKRRGTAKATPRQSRAHTVKRLPYIIRIKGPRP